ncbi:hypothetical protein F4703DRAFT_1954434 [Phycomyces blakesleeanus]
MQSTAFENAQIEAYLNHTMACSGSFAIESHGPPVLSWPNVKEEPDLLNFHAETLASTSLINGGEQDNSCTRAAVPLAQILEHFPDLYDFLFHPYFPTFARLWLDFQYQTVLAKEAKYRPIVIRWLELVVVHLSKIPRSTFIPPITTKANQNLAESQGHHMLLAFFSIKERIEAMHQLLQSVENERIVIESNSLNALSNKQLNTQSHLATDPTTQQNLSQLGPGLLSCNQGPVVPCVSGSSQIPLQQTIVMANAQVKSTSAPPMTDNIVFFSPGLFQPQICSNNIYWPETCQTTYTNQLSDVTFNSMGTIQALMDSHSPLNYQYNVNESPFVESPETTCSEDSSSAPKQGPHSHPHLQNTPLSSEATVAPMKTYIQPSGIWSLPQTPSVYPSEASAFWSCPTTPGNIWCHQEGETAAISEGDQDLDENDDIHEDDGKESDYDDGSDDVDDPDYIDDDTDREMSMKKRSICNKMNEKSISIQDISNSSSSSSSSAHFPVPPSGGIASKKARISKINNAEKCLSTTRRTATSYDVTTTHYLKSVFFSIYSKREKLTKDQRRQVQEQTGLKPRNITYWFSNHKRRFQTSLKVFKQTVRMSGGRVKTYDDFLRWRKIHGLGPEVNDNEQLED